MRPALALLLLALTACSSTKTNGIDWIVYGERTGIFEDLDFLTCSALTGVSGPTVQVTFFFGKESAPVGTIGIEALVPGSPIQVGSHERGVFAGPTRLYTYLDDDRPAVDTFDAALEGAFSNGIQTRYELALGDEVPEYVNGEVSPVPKLQVFVPILRISPGQTYTDPNNEEVRPVSGHIEDVRMYCTSMLGGAP